MHNYMLFISTEKTDLKIKTSSLCPDDIGMYGIADYIGEELPFPERLAGITVGQDGKIVFTRQDIERFFKWRFDFTKAKCSEVTLQDFCSTNLFEIRYSIEERFETYVVPITDPLNENYYAETLDSFLRETYKYFDEYERQTFYIIAAVDYHW